MRVRVMLAAHSNEIATVNKDGASFINVRAASSCMGKLVFSHLKLGVPCNWLVPFLKSRFEAVIKNKTTHVTILT
jgi:hypothetical protein